MHPAYSLILFTVSSGAGYGLLAVLGLTLLLDAAPPVPWLLLTALGLGLGLASFGLLASTRHLKRPERAWRAFSQWRTSWLSREGLAALAVYAAALPLAGLLLLLPAGNGFVRLLATATAALAVVTILCTAMIYASLKPIPRWRHPAVPVVYLCLGLATGALLLDALFLLAGRDAVLPRALALLALLGAFIAKELSWRAAGRREPALTAAAATGLACFGEVRLLEAPHTEGNYLLREMGYQVARRHAAKLRRVVRLAAFAVPSILVAVLLLVAEPPPILRGALAVLAAGSAVLGALIERWLFFAEARHTVSLYYGAGAV
jgi:sulfite dehydrogenase (quinone) subunit SoeC